MNHIVSADEEKRLTRAIEKAATLATVNESLDRNTLLADQLKREGVDPKFAKTAAAAFNKRISVLTFQKTADEHRAEPFALTDPNVVFKLVGGEDMNKSASLAVNAAPFHIGTYTAAPMQKAASARKSSYVNYEDRVDLDVFTAHVESMLDKHAARLSELTGEFESLESQIKVATDKLAEYFQKSACASFEFNTAKNVYGNEFADAFKEALPENTDFSKTASAAIIPNTQTFKALSDLMEKRAALKDKKADIELYAKGLYELSKGAAIVGDEIAFVKNAGMLDAAGGIFDVISATGENIVRSGGAMAAAALDGTKSGIGASMDMLRKGKGSVATAADYVLDAEFANKERYKNRLMAYSDMTADPQLALYPAEQLFNATQKAMDMDNSLENSGNREILRSTVAQLLAQNNRVSTADIAALATTMKARDAKEKNAVVDAISKVKLLGDVERTDAADLMSTMPQMTGTGDKSGAQDRLQNAFKLLRELEKEVKADEKEKERAAADKDKEKRREEEKAYDRVLAQIDKSKQHTIELGKLTAQTAAQQLQAKDRAKQTAIADSIMRAYRAALNTSIKHGTFPPSAPTIIFSR